MTTLYHGSPFPPGDKLKLQPAYQITGELVTWDVTESNEYLYATTDRAEAINQAFASFIEKRFDMKRYQSQNGRIVITLYAGSVVPDKQSITASDCVWLYTIHDRRNVFKPVHNKHNNLKTEYKTDKAIPEENLTVERVNLRAWLSDKRLSFEVEKTHPTTLHWAKGTPKMEQQPIFDDKSIVALENVLLGLGDLSERIQNQGGLTQQLALESEFIMGGNELTSVYHNTTQVVKRQQLAMENIFQKAKDVVVSAVKKMVEFLKKLWYAVFEPKFMKIRRLKKHLETFDDMDRVLRTLETGDFDQMLTVALKQGGLFKNFVDSMSPLQLAIVSDTVAVKFFAQSKSLDQQIIARISHDKIAKVLNGGLTSLEAFRDKWGSVMEKVESGASQEFSKKADLHAGIAEDFTQWTNQSTDTITFGVHLGGMPYKVDKSWTDIIRSVMTEFTTAEKELAGNAATMRTKLYSEAGIIKFNSTTATLNKMIKALKLWVDDRFLSFYTTETERIMKDLDGFIKHMEKLERNPSPSSRTSTSKELIVTNGQFNTSSQHTFLDTKFIEGLRILTKACNDIGSIFAYVEKKINLGMNGLKKVYILYADLFAKAMDLDVYSRIINRGDLEKGIIKYRALADQLK